MVTAQRNIHSSSAYTLPFSAMLLPGWLGADLSSMHPSPSWASGTQWDSTSGKQLQVAGGQRERDLRSLLSHGSGRGCVPLGPHLQPRSPSSLASAGTGLSDYTRTSSGLCRRRSVKSFLLLMAPGCLIISLALYLSANIPLITFSLV